MKKIWGNVSWKAFREVVPYNYTEAQNGEFYSTGLFGQGFGGEPLVCLNHGDDGGWFKELCKKENAWFKESL